MSKSGRAVRRAAKSKQIHFWVAPSLERLFVRAAKDSGEALTVARRAAMQCYIDQNAGEGSTFVFEGSLVLAKSRVLMRVFTYGKDEILIRLSGAPVSRMSELAREAQVPIDLGAYLLRLMQAKGSNGRNGERSEA